MMKRSRKLMAWIDKYFGEHVETKMRMARLVFVMGVVGLVVDLVYNAFVMKVAGFNIITPVVGLVALVISFWISTAVEDCEKIFFVLLLLANTILFPVAFLFGGSFRSGEVLWLLVGQLIVFLILNGWRFYVCAFFSFASLIATYAISIKNPDLAVIGVSMKTLALGSLISLVTVTVWAGLLYRYQNMIYEKEKKLAEERAKEVEESAASKELFFANMSHEIRTPINTIIGLNEMILREDVSDEIAENAINIQNAGKMLLAIINDILDLSKIESGKMDIVPVQYETASMYSDLVNIIWVKANQKKLDFKIDIAEDIPSMLYGDEIRIKQVLTNILNNAVKYTQKGSITLTVTGEQVDNNIIRLKMIVEDTGIGIKKESIGDLFTVFKRVDQENTTRIEGTGLGLAITKQLVDMMGGTIMVDSIYGKGSLFTVIIDQEIIDRNPLGAMHYTTKRDAKSREKYNRSFEAPKARVLVVDDNEMNLMVAKKLLRDTKVQVELASSGKECLEKTLTDSYHVILMDHMMPQMDGEQTLGALRSRKEGFCQNTPAIALTANVMPNALQWYQSRGFDGYLAKPISGSLLEAALVKFLPKELIEYSENNIVDSTMPELEGMSIHRNKKRIQICTDSIADIPSEWIKRFDINQMYVYVITEEGRFIDTQEIFSDELLEYMATGRAARSNIASTKEYEEYFAERLVEADQVIYITMASGSSLAFKNALQASASFDNVFVIDSGHLSCGQGIMVLWAAKMAQDGASIDDIIYKMSTLRDKISTSFIVQDPENMYRGGRISKRLRDICLSLNLHPILAMTKDKISLSGIAIGSMDHARLSYIRRCLRLTKRIDSQLLFICHAGLGYKELDRIKAEVEKYKKFDRVIYQGASATVSSNCGIGCFGLIYMLK